VLILADYIRRCQDETDPVTKRVRKRFLAAWVFSPLGAGKTSYALNVGAHVFHDGSDPIPPVDAWHRALSHLYLNVTELIKIMEQAIEQRQRIPYLILDDAGYWLHKLTWWEREKVAFMSFFQFMRTACCAIIFTSPVDELPKPMRKLINFRIRVEPITWEEARGYLSRSGHDTREIRRMLREQGRNPDYWNKATGYYHNVMPSFKSRIKKRFVDVYPLDMPAEIYDRYEYDMRYPSVQEAFRRWKQSYQEAKRGPGRPRVHPKPEPIEI